MPFGSGLENRILLSPRDRSLSFLRFSTKECSSPATQAGPESVSFLTNELQKPNAGIPTRPVLMREADGQWPSQRSQGSQRSPGASPCLLHFPRSTTFCNSKSGWTGEWQLSGKGTVEAECANPDASGCDEGGKQTVIRPRASPSVAFRILPTPNAGESEMPDRVVSEMAKKLRAGNVLIDRSQNSDFKTTVSVYAMRAPGASIATAQAFPTCPLNSRSALAS